MLPLEGIRVLDWTIWQQGPVATTMLGDLGADVIKLEGRGGDPGRTLATGGVAGPEKRPNFYFESHNRNKRGLTVDLKQDAGRELVHDLVEHCDVFVQNFRKGVAGRLGLDYATLRERNPKLVYASATGYGAFGPDSAEPSFDHLGLARSGIMQAAGEPDMPPLGIAGGIADQMGGVMLAYAVMAALVARERHGIGQEVDASHLGSMLWLQGLSVSCRLMAGSALPRTHRSQAGNPLWNHYRCRDDRWIALAMLQPDRYWADFVRAVGRPELADDPRFADAGARASNRLECVALLDEVFGGDDLESWLERLRAAPGDFIFTRVNQVADLPDDPQVRANDYVVDFDHPRHGPTQVLGVPVRLSETPGRVRRPAPLLGEHSEEVLREVLGLSDDRLRELREKQVI